MRKFPTKKVSSCFSVELLSREIISVSAKEGKLKLRLGRGEVELRLMMKLMLTVGG